VFFAASVAAGVSAGFSVVCAAAVVCAASVAFGAAVVALALELELEQPAIREQAIVAAINTEISFFFIVILPPCFCQTHTYWIQFVFLKYYFLFTLSIVIEKYCFKLYIFHVFSK
jgi:hypothetical protein